MAQPAFTLAVVAAPEDIDELGHVSNLVYVRWVLEAATAHSIAVGWSFADYRRIGGAFVVRRQEIDYLASARVGDAIDLVTWVTDWRGASSARRTDVVRLADGVVLARGTTQWAFVDLARARPRRIPDEIRQAFGPATSDRGTFPSR